MIKPDSLRKHLASSNDDLRRNPDKMLIFADEGNMVAVGTQSLSFEYRYRLNLIITDYAGDPNAVMVPLLAWIRVHQSDLVDNPERRKNGIRFEVDFNNKETVDLSITMDLTERVVVTPGPGGRLDVMHRPEPQATPVYTDDFWSLYSGDALLAEWHTPALGA
jgi:hypothetical protein